MVKNFLIVLKNLKQIQQKLLQIEQYKKAEATGDLIHNKTADKISSISKSLHLICTQKIMMLIMK